MSERYLITGGAVFLGNNLCRFRFARMHFVRTLDIAPFNYPEASQVNVVDGDVRNRSRIKARPGVTHRVPWKKGALQLAKYAF
jgi:nucleoside-diphosphate-sugar epimerase